jgi:chitinase
MHFWKERIIRRMMTAKFFFSILFTVVFLLTSQAICFASTVALQWDAVTDTGLAGYKVYYQADSSVQPFTGTGATQGASPVDVLKLTTATISGLDPAHAYYFAITAYNTSGVESAYSNIVFVPELISPTISLGSPANNATVSGTVSVTASASDNVGVTKVEFYVNGVLQSSDTATPYGYSWNTSSLASGTYTLMAKAYDAAGNVGQSTNVAVTVVKDTTAPVVSLTAPSNYATVNGTVTVSAYASDNVGVSKVEFSVDGALRAAVNTTPYNYYWNSIAAGNGSHTLSVKAYDATGNVSTTSLVTVTVSNNSISQNVITGDINGDGIVDVSDALLALQIAVGNVQSAPDELQRGDIAPLINGVPVPNGIIDIGDVIVILSIAAGKIVL